jgi:hypothetical protein
VVTSEAATADFHRHPGGLDRPVLRPPGPPGGGGRARYIEGISPQ